MGLTARRAALVQNEIGPLTEFKGAKSECPRFPPCGYKIILEAAPAGCSGHPRILYFQRSRRVAIRRGLHGSFTNISSPAPGPFAAWDVQGWRPCATSIRARIWRPYLPGKEEVVFAKLEVAARAAIEHDGADVIITLETAVERHEQSVPGLREVARTRAHPFQARVPKSSACAGRSAVSTRIGKLANGGCAIE